MSIDKYEPTEDIILEQEENSDSFSVEKIENINIDYEKNIEEVEKTELNENKDEAQKEISIKDFILENRFGESEDWILEWSETLVFNGKEIFEENGESRTKIAESADQNNIQVQAHYDMINNFINNPSEPYMMPDWVEQTEKGDIIHSTALILSSDGHHIISESWKHEDIEDKKEKEKEKEEDEEDKKDEENKLNINFDLEEDILNTEKQEENLVVESIKEEQTIEVSEIKNSENKEEIKIENTSSSDTKKEIKVKQEEAIDVKNIEIKTDKSTVINESKVNLDVKPAENFQEVVRIEARGIKEDGRAEHAVTENKEIINIDNLEKQEENLVVESIKQEQVEFSVAQNIKSDTTAVENNREVVVENILNVDTKKEPEVKLEEAIDVKNTEIKTDKSTVINESNINIKPEATITEIKKIREENKYENIGIKDGFVDSKIHQESEKKVENFQIEQTKEVLENKNISELNNNINNVINNEVKIEQKIDSISTKEQHEKTLEEKIINLFKVDSLINTKESEENNIKKESTVKISEVPVETNLDKVVIQNEKFIPQKEISKIETKLNTENMIKINNLDFKKVEKLENIVLSKVEDINIEKNNIASKKIENSEVKNILNKKESILDKADVKNVTLKSEIISQNIKNQDISKVELTKEEEKQIHSREIFMRTLGLSSYVNNEGVKIYSSNARQSQEEQDVNLEKDYINNRLSNSKSNLNGISLKIAA